MNDDDEAWDLSEQILELLEHPRCLLPEFGPSDALIASTVRDVTELHAYATAVGVRAEVLLNDQKFTEVVEHADLLERVGQLAAEPRLQWMGAQLQGRALVERGTVANHPYIWRAMPTGQRVMPATIDVQAALISFLKADRLRHGAINDLGIAHNLKNAAHALHLLGDHAQAHQFEYEAREIFGESPAITNLLMYEGKWGVARQDDAKGGAMLRMSAGLADEYGLRLMVSSALGGLADLYTRQQRWSEARDCAEVALALWPYARGARDARRFVEVLGRAPRQTRVSGTRRSTFPFNFLPADVDS
jgi:hypothetical protein